MTPLTQAEKDELLTLARESITAAANGKPLPPVNLAGKSAALAEQGAAFVTLTQNGQLRGCIGALQAYQPLILDVIEHAATAAMHDYRFSPVQPREVAGLKIEISVLSQPKKIAYGNSEELRRLIRPGVDGVILRDGARRATFLPQVWQQLPELDEFMAHLCLKMGVSADTWKKKKLEISLYQVEDFSE